AHRNRQSGPRNGPAQNPTLWFWLFLSKCRVSFGAQEKQVAFWKSKYYQRFISEVLKKAVPKAVPKVVQHKTQRSGFAYFYQNVE
ncbi:MAG: hypothetical protein RI946_477, partial [Pseudomonadota bacterium]